MTRFKTIYSLLNHLGKGFTISILFCMYIFIASLSKISFHSLKRYLLKHLRVLKSIKGDTLQILSNSHIDQGELIILLEPGD